METLGDRVKKRRNELGISQQDLARMVGAGQGTIGHLEGGRNKTFKDILALAAALQTTPEYLQYGTEGEHKNETFPRIPSENDYVLIPQFTAKGACGDGEWNEHVEIRGNLAFKRDWMEKMGLKKENLEVIYAKGDSMLPTIADGAAVLLDHSKIIPQEGKVYMIYRAGNGIIIKRMARDRDGSWLYQSDNANKTQFPDLFPLSDDKIMARVVWQGGSSTL